MATWVRRRFLKATLGAVSASLLLLNGKFGRAQSCGSYNYYDPYDGAGGVDGGGGNGGGGCTVLDYIMQDGSCW